MDELFRLGLNNAAWAAGLAVVAAVGSRVWRSRPALAHALWLLVLLKLATPSVLKVAQPWSEPMALELQAAHQPNSLPRLAAAAKSEISPSPGSQRIVVPKGDVAPGRSQAERAPEHAATDTRTLVRPWSWRTLIGLVWLAGAGLWWGFVGLSLVRFRRLLEQARAAPPELAERVRRQAAGMELGARWIPTAGLVPARVAPMVFASFSSKPRLLLPEELWGRLDSSQQDAVLAHELAHLKRGDHWVRWLEAIVLGIYWWYPIAWWARREVERTEEEACDGWVLWSQPDAAGAYAEALVATTAFLSGYRRPLPIGASGVRNTLSLKRRLGMILADVENAPVTRSRSWKLLAAGAVCLPLLPALSSGKTQESAADGNSGQAPASAPQAKSAPDSGQAAVSAPQAKSAPAPGQTSNKDPQAKSAPPATVAKKRGGTDVRNSDNRVKVSRAITRGVREYVDVEPTNLQSAKRVDLRAQVGGMLQGVACKPAQRIKRGDVLFEIDSRIYALERQKADAEVRRLQSRVRSIAGRVQAINRNQIGANDEITRLQAEQEEAETVLLGAQADLDLASLKVDGTKVTAPFDGVVARVRVSSGDFVEAGKTDLATIVSQGLLYADVSVEESTARRIEQAKLHGEDRAGCEVVFGVRNEKGFPHTASIDFVDPEVQATNAVRIRLLVTDPEGSFRPGLFVRVRISLGAPREAVLIPEKAIGSNGGGQQYVYVLNDKNIVEFRFIKVGQLYDDLRAVETGVRADEWVVLSQAGKSQLGVEVPADNIDRLEASPQAAEKPATR